MSITIIQLMLHALEKKSQIAIEFCYRFRDAHRGNAKVFWVHAGSAQRFDQAYKDITRRCRLPGWDNPAPYPLELVSDWLSDDDNWLSVLDNADDREVLYPSHQGLTARVSEIRGASMPLATHLPQTSNGGSILIISRSGDAVFRLTNAVENIIQIPFMDEEDARLLSLRKLPKDQSDDTERGDLVRLLDFLPLAITQAAAYISVKRMRMSIYKYCDILRQNKDILLVNINHLRRDLTVPNSVILTWQISFEQIDKESPPGAELLSLMSVFDRQGIPEYLFRCGYEDDLMFESAAG